MKILFLLPVFLISQVVTAQNPVLVGTLPMGGADSAGVIYQINGDGTGYTILHSFCNPSYVLPNGNTLTRVGNKFFGATTINPDNDFGIIFCYDSLVNSFSILFNFSIPQGAYPSGSLLLASDGNLYGLTSSGGLNNGGVLFRFNPTNSLYTDLYDFDGSAGIQPAGTSLMQASNGKLYGMTTLGGVDYGGTIFSFDISNNNLVHLADLDTLNGISPHGNLVEGTNGFLYGMTSRGGAFNRGVIFSFDTTTNLITKLLDFDGVNGNCPWGNLAISPGNKLFGMTDLGGMNNKGVLFSFDPSSLTYTDEHDFTTADGIRPWGSPICASNGTIYGMTVYGGTHNAGVIFSYDPSTSQYTDIFNFDISSGQFPNGNLIESNGFLYGLNTGGCSNGMGGVFNVNIGTSAYLLLHDLTGFGHNSIEPQGKLLQASDGKLYGLTEFGGFYNGGTIFSYDPSTGIFEDLHNFDFWYNGSANAFNPVGNLMQASNGKIYGVTLTSAIFSYDISSHLYTWLINMSYPISSSANGSLIEANNGKLYGMSNSGGGAGYGNIFSYDTSTNIATSVHSCIYTEGIFPYGGLVMATNGRLYGMTSDGFTNIYGSLFSYIPSNGGYGTLKYFNYNTGAEPYLGSLIQASNGKLYGLTCWYGPGGHGTLFSYNIGSSAFSMLVAFNGSNGAEPWNSLTEASDGKLYGTTHRGGAYDYGVIFRYDTTSGICQVIKNFDGIAGGHPYQDITELNSTVSILTSEKKDPAFSLVPNPASTFFTIRTGASKIERITLYNMIGEEVMIIESQKANGSDDEVNIDISNLKPGVYIVQVNAGKKSWRGKMLKQ